MNKIKKFLIINKFLLLFLFITFNTEFNFGKDLVEEQFSSYFLPEDHPIKPKLDGIFNKSGILTNRSTLIRRGFSVSEYRSSTNLYIAKHIELNGYLLKVFLNDQTKVLDEWQNWVKRIDGAHVIQDAIERNGFQKYFKVPKKWIYKLRFIEKSNEKKYILVVEDMDLVSPERNKKYWKSLTHINYDKLKALYTLVQNQGLYDSIFIDNIPFSKDKKIAFVDTEHFHKWPVKLERIIKYLDPISKNQWNEIINNK